MFLPFLIVRFGAPVYLGVFQALPFYGNILLSLPIKKIIIYLLVCYKPKKSLRPLTRLKIFIKIWLDRKKLNMIDRIKPKRIILFIFVIAYIYFTYRVVIY